MPIHLQQLGTRRHPAMEQLPGFIRTGRPDPVEHQGLFDKSTQEGRPQPVGSQKGNRQEGGQCHDLIHQHQDLQNSVEDLGKAFGLEHGCWTVHPKKTRTKTHRQVRAHPLNQPKWFTNILHYIDPGKTTCFDTVIKMSSVAKSRAGLAVPLDHGVTGRSYMVRGVQRSRISSRIFILRAKFCRAVRCWEPRIWVPPARSTWKSPRVLTFPASTGERRPTALIARSVQSSASFIQWFT